MNPTYGVYSPAGLWLRLLVDVIDVLVISAVWYGLAIALDAAFPSSTWMPNLFLATCAIAIFYYLVILKRSKTGTIGSLVYCLRTLGLDGRPARLGPLTFRTLFAVLSPLNWLDSIWIAGDTPPGTARQICANVRLSFGKPAQPC